jgi:hypothetical protein
LPEQRAISKRVRPSITAVQPLDQETTMSAVVSSLGTGNTTAENTLKQKTRNAGVVSGGHWVAKALKNEGIDPREYAPGTKNQTMYK